MKPLFDSCSSSPQWLHAATTELKRYQRAGRTAVLVLIDIDRFKDVNDGYGHTVGDEVVEEFARLLKACLRDVDTGGATVATSSAW